jgi:hypothetical protein
MAEEKERKPQTQNAARKPEVGAGSASSQEELKQPDEWLKNAIERIDSKGSDDLEVQPTINKLEYQTTISRSESQTSPFPTDKIVRHSPAEKAALTSTNPSSASAATHLQFVYSLIGLLFGIASTLVGLILVVRGVAGSVSWSAALLGLRADQISDTIPGVILIALGIFVIFITRFQKH